jgi:hypothetical protein
MEQERMFGTSEGEEGLDEGALQEMLQMEQATQDAIDYEEAMEAQAMREVLCCDNHTILPTFFCFTSKSRKLRILRLRFGYM